MFTICFDEEAGCDTSLVGGKALGLAEMTQAGLPVAPGFTVSTAAYSQYLESSGLRSRIIALLGAVDRDSITALENAEKTIADWFVREAFPDAVRTDLLRAYDALCASTGIEDVSVAVRSSATAEDAAEASFAGEYETFVGMSGAEQVELFVRRCWASAYTARSMAYAWKNGISPNEVEMAVVVQKAVQARASGVMFTLSPLTGDRSRIVIEAAYGLGLAVVGGEVTPDRYTVSKIGLALGDKVLGDKHIEYLDGSEATGVDEARRAQFCLSDEEVMHLAGLGKTLEKQRGHPVDVEFALDRDLAEGSNLVLLQCRPETYWTSRHQAARVDPVGDAAQAVLATALKMPGSR